MRGSLQSTVTLNSGLPMPILGLGVWRLSPGAETIRVTADALALGYRLIDTAAGYENERHRANQAARRRAAPSSRCRDRRARRLDPEQYFRALAPRQ